MPDTIQAILHREIGPIRSIHTEEFEPEVPFLDYVERFAPLADTVMLLSGGTNDCARFHIIGAFPRLVISGARQRLTLTTTRADSGEPMLHLFGQVDHFAVLGEILAFFAIPGGQGLPIGAGLLGYLAYDLKDQLEALPRTTIDPQGLPELYCILPELLLIHDRMRRQTIMSIPRFAGQVDPVAQIKEKLAGLAPSAGNSFHLKKLRSETEKPDFISRIEKIRSAIRAGKVYQVNYSQTFEGVFSGCPYTLFKELFHDNPAPFFAYIQAGDHQVLSTSPERFLKLRDNQVETRPIKGTRPRGMDRAEDRALRADLLESRKDDAELAMIVDLMRNDLGKVCRLGSVRLREHKRVESYRNVHHLVSIIEGELEDHRSPVDLLKACFPGGSISGCPKISALQMIDRLEATRRHVYTGAIGYLSFHRTLDLSIAIRTATICGNRIRFSAGGGIVYDSDPVNEYEETLHKGATFLKRNEPEAPPGEPFLWMNGLLTTGDKAFLPVVSEGYQYGYGLFETLRATAGKAAYLGQHLERLRFGWNKLFKQAFPDLSWEEIIRQVICANGLEKETAAIKIIVSKAATQGRQRQAVPEVDIIVSGRPYVHRLASKTEDGLHLGVYTPSRQTPLAELKSLNHLFYILAGQWAEANGYDEAVVLNPDGSVSETNSANLILIYSREAVIPESPQVLSGIMQAAVVQQLKKLDFAVKGRIVSRKDLLAADQVLLCNSLMGVVPALSVDGVKINHCQDLCRALNRQILAPD